MNISVLFTGGTIGSKCLGGVMCDVVNCTYNDGRSHCYAGSISVGPQSADCCAETVCSTFKPKAY